MFLSLPDPSPVVYRYAVGDGASYAAVMSAAVEGKRPMVRETISTEVLSVAPDGTAEVRVRFTARKPSGGVVLATPGDVETTLRLDPYGRAEGIESLDEDARLFAISLRIPSEALTPGKEAPVETGEPYALGNVTILATFKRSDPKRVEWAFRADSPERGQNFRRSVAFDPVRGILLSARLNGDAEGVKVAMTLDRKEAGR